MNHVKLGADAFSSSYGREFWSGVYDKLKQFAPAQCTLKDMSSDGTQAVVLMYSASKPDHPGAILMVCEDGQWRTAFAETFLKDWMSDAPTPAGLGRDAPLAVARIDDGRYLVVDFTGHPNPAPGDQFNIFHDGKNIAFADVYRVHGSEMTLLVMGRTFRTVTEHDPVVGDIIKPTGRSEDIATARANTYYTAAPSADQATATRRDGYHKVTYRVMGISTKTHIFLSNMEGGTETHDVYQLPWETSFNAPAGQSLYLSVDTEHEVMSAVTVQILIDDLIYKTAQGDGADTAHATCDGVVPR
jgi:hypothetical protein